MKVKFNPIKTVAVSALSFLMLSVSVASVPASQTQSDPANAPAGVSADKEHQINNVAAAAADGLQASNVMFQGAIEQFSNYCSLLQARGKAPKEALLCHKYATQMTKLVGDMTKELAASLAHTYTLKLGKGQEAADVAAKEIHDVVAENITKQVTTAKAVEKSAKKAIVKLHGTADHSQNASQPSVSQ